MKKGFIDNKHPDENINLNDYVWFVGMIGKTYMPNIFDKWNAVPQANWGKRGLIHKPSMEATVYENGSFFLELLQNLAVYRVNLGAPVIIDIYDVPNMIDFDQLLVYTKYIQEQWMENNGLEKKPLLRLSMGTWNGWVNNHPAQIVNILNKVDILAAQWKVTRPDTWREIGTPKWWEYDDGLVAYDGTGKWEQSPVDYIPPIEPPVEPPVSGVNLEDYYLQLPPLGGLFGGKAEFIKK